MSSARAKIGPGGRLVIPAAQRRELGLEVGDLALNGFRSQARGNRLHGEAEAHDALLVITAAEQQLVVRDFLLHAAHVDLAGVAVEADFGRPVLAAGIGAAADVDLQRTHGRVRRRNPGGCEQLLIGQGQRARSQVCPGLSEMAFDDYAISGRTCLFEERERGLMMAIE